MKRVVLLKLSGEALSKKDGFGLDMEKVNNVAGEIKTLKDTGVNYSIFEYDFTNNYASINTENTGSNRVKGIFGDYVLGAKKDVLDLEIFIDIANNI